METFTTTARRSREGLTSGWWLRWIMIAWIEEVVEWVVSSRDGEWIVMVVLVGDELVLLTTLSMVGCA
ncbi:hypothetical protein C5167_002662 [Papaver somniferum]|uniref:Uncharacterized protein n=1 Tax=Papaver somniferum TaxID=3469 RepID=A0A4Y7KVC6_PAPSO|nr:hypothetical protein C5167_002662 [Papaver somniferum]